MYFNEIPTMQYIRKFSSLMSGVLGFTATTYFAWTLYKNNLPQNIATWLMVLLLEIIGLWSVLKDGNKKPYLQVGWAAAALCVVLAITLGNSPWHWGWTESISLFLCAVAIFLFLTISARMAIWTYMIAMYISFVPLMVDYWYRPQLETLWFWFWNITACLFAVYGAPKRDFANVFIPWASIFQNALVILLCIL